MKSRLVSACAAAFLVATGAGCGAGFSNGGAAPDVRAAKSLAETKTLFSGRTETSLDRKGQRFVRREAILPFEPFSTFAEAEDLFRD